MKNKKPTKRDLIISQAIYSQMKEISQRLHEREYIKAIQEAKALHEKMGRPPDEKPLIGWKEILQAMNVTDKRTAKKILLVKKLLRYEGRSPILMLSDYREAQNIKK